MRIFRLEPITANASCADRGFASATRALALAAAVPSLAIAAVRSDLGAPMPETLDQAESEPR